MLQDSLTPLNSKASANEAALAGLAADGSEGGESEAESVEDPMFQVAEHEHCREAKQYLRPTVAHPCICFGVHV